MPGKKKPTQVITGKFDTGRQAREMARETIGIVKASRTETPKLKKGPKHKKNVLHDPDA